MCKVAHPLMPRPHLFGIPTYLKLKRHLDNWILSLSKLKWIISWNFKPVVKLQPTKIPSPYLFYYFLKIMLYILYFYFTMLN
jgi:hypothetical protein